jgi:molecular chaperone DnaK
MPERIGQLNQNYPERNLFAEPSQESDWCGKVVRFFKEILCCFRPIATVFDRTVVQEQAPLPSRPDSPDIIGIDLGTTNSCVAILKGGVVEVFSDEKGSRTTPSVISYKGNEPVVGEAEKDQTTLFSTKRFIGRKYDEVESETRNVPYKVIKNEEGNPVFEINGKLITPEEAAAQILMKMKTIAETRLGRKVEKAVVTVPAYFNDAQRQATREAGRIAGLDVVRIIAEPTAAALAYGIDKDKAAQNIAVYDLGGGTFDVSILNIDDGIFQVRSTNGDTHLGGDDFDQAIVEWMMAQMGNPSLDKMEMQRLRDAAIKAKIELSNQESVQIPNTSIVLTRANLEEICRGLIERSAGPCNIAMKDAKTTKAKIDHAVLVGGMTRMPAVQQAVEKIFGRTPNTSVNPDEAVAIGAAIQGGIIAGDVDNMLLIDVAPLTLGIELEGGVMSPLIRRNTSIPTSVRRSFSTATDNQTSVKIKVFQGERPLTVHNTEIGSFELVGIPPAPRGTPEIEVTFEINGDGILQVKARDKVTGKEHQVRIQAKAGLTKEEVHGKIKDSELHQAEDSARLEMIQLRNRANELILSARHSLAQHKKIISAKDSAKIETCIDALKKALEGDDAKLLKSKTQDLHIEVVCTNDYYRVKNGVNISFENRI